MGATQYYDVAVAAPLPSALTYGWEGEPLLPGTSVEVPLGSRRVTGVILRQGEQPASVQIKNIAEVSVDRPLLPASYLRWLSWMAHYYVHPIGQVLALAYPPLPPSTRPSRKTSPIPVFAEGERPARPQLTDEQNAVLSSIREQSGFHTHLLFGVTGSGKTEVYLQLLEDVLRQGRSSLVLVPEISLTPQLLSRFAARFENQVAVIHSHLTEREKTHQWWLAHRGTKRILLGARSALFCPLPDLGMVILDEEHEPSFKQDEKLKYHARDSAMMLAKISNVPLILGTATPSLETYQRACEGRYLMHRMNKRIQERHLPSISVTDMRAVRSARREQPSDLPFWLSEDLYVEIEHCIARGEQAALFLNRRGIAQVAICESCGFSHECPNCSISLTVHQQTHLVCHYCDYTQELRPKCPSCPDGEVQPLGIGTERVERDIRQLFPKQRIARADRDEIQSRQELENFISEMEKGEIDILIGTQMIAKGLDFPKLTVVGLVLADVGFHIPDFRASERSFQLIVQVAGRAGRHSKDPGKVIIQTYDPTHVAIEQACHGDFEQFANQELIHRQALNYPPFGKLALIRFQGLDEKAVEQTAQRFTRRAQQLQNLRPELKAVQVLGPAPSAIAKLRNKFRYQCLLKTLDPQLLNLFCRTTIRHGKWIPKGVAVQIDVDPTNML
jgi:primosomal protein N' (replication factor Y)